ncbi:RluA family pseudouridine synthase [Lacihabitans sp. CS3-21]|uniref:RluA family pseudouridine synthase n=1 Tax=Lacihabitans sp. CS3-21 TaxID=2487332 RepID=UPI0020CE2715|nr:RluA family pseudouridine synthase [Lacihabitans sp. CS3-21]MCP9745971.1 RluA family pseudouridine synthase [Lacihabitans sp. CS3-21]
MNTLEKNIDAFDDEEDEIIETIVINVDPGQTFMRLDKYLSHHLKSISRNRIQNAIETDSVKVNENNVKPSYKVKPLDKITLSLAKASGIPSEVLPEDIPLNIVYEDDDLMIVNKSPEMVVHPGHGNHTGTLVNALVHHFANLPTGTDGKVRPGLVHRIDKGTSGLLVIAKTEYAMQFLAKQFADHTTERTYNALIWGEPKEPKGTINAHIGRGFKDRRISDVFPEGDYGKEAITHYEVIKNMRYVSLIKCKLETGRTHQIRAHMKYIGHTLFNDATYGGDKVLRGDLFSKYKQFVENCFEIIPRQALHAKSLGFIHPTTKEWMQFDSELPEDFTKVLEKWDHYLQFK